MIKLAIRLYNTLSGKKEPLETWEPGVVKMYSCGPTVYNFFHIGNARAFVTFDMIRRYLKYRGYQVKFVQNFTDVDDKLINKANELQSTVEEVANRFIAEYFIDAKTIGIDAADVHPRVTGTMEEIIAFIDGLVKAGYAYVAGGDVLFETPKFKTYGKLSKQSLEELLSGTRIEVSDIKRHPTDFTLWKAAKPGEPWWDSPWGKGRPGWHIECSAMIHKHLGDHIDIHGGGHDLVFPHHENEIAQSEALLGAPLSRYFMHNGYININNEKMSKSLGNSVNVRDLAQKYDPRALRLFLISAHYRNPINFSDEVMQQMVAAMQRIDASYEHLVLRLQSLFLPEGEAINLSAFENRLIEGMDDDFNSAVATGVLFDLVREINMYLRTDQLTKNGLLSYKEKLDAWLNLYGLVQREQVTDNDEIERLLEERMTARKARNFARGDAIRNELEKMGVHVEDTSQGTRWWRD